HEKLKQRLQEFLFGILGNVPLADNLPDRRLAALTQPLRHELVLLTRLAAQLRTDRAANLGKVALLDFQVAIHPVLGEDLQVPVVEDALSAEVIEDVLDSVPQVLGSHAEGTGPRLDPGEGRIEPFVSDLHAAPG